jgi:hypothetical protein
MSRTLCSHCSKSCSRMSLLSKIIMFNRKWPVAWAPGRMKRHAHTLHTALAARGHSVHVLTFPPPHTEDELSPSPNGPELHFLDSGPGQWRCDQAWKLYEGTKRRAGGGHAVPQHQGQHRRGRRVRLHVRAHVESLLERLETVVAVGAACQDYAKVHVRGPQDSAGVREALPLRQERGVLRVPCRVRLVLRAEHFFCNDYTF